MVSLFYTTSQVCGLFHISSRTLDRYRKWKVNPFPKPHIAHVGSESLYLIADVHAWIDREHERTIEINRVFN